MPNRTKRDLGSDLMRCPRCGSHHTQSLPTAYSYSSHVFRKGLNPDAMAGAPEPPRRRSEIIAPAIIGTIVFSAVHVGGVVAAYELELFASFEGIYDKRVLTPAAIAGLAVAIGIIWRAARWNSSVFKSLLEDWRSTVICRRCSTQFRPAESKKR